MSADDEADQDDRDLPLESDMDDSDEPDLMPCPFCRQMITEDHELCPHCRNYINVADAPRQTPVWLLIVAAVAIIAILVTWVIKAP